MYVNGKLAAKVDTSGTYFYHTDPAGSPIAMTDSAGVIAWKADYKPFGEELITSATEENYKMFVGKEKDRETGLYYFGARYMQDKTARFVSVDPVGPVDDRSGQINQTILLNPQRLNRYAYGLNNPYAYVDHNGKFSVRATSSGIELSYSHKVNKLAWKSIRFATKTGARLIGVGTTAVEKAGDAVFGKAVSYKKQGWGIEQAVNEPISDYRFDKSLSDEQRKWTEGIMDEPQALELMNKFTERKEYKEMGYPEPQAMIDQAKKNYEESKAGELGKKLGPKDIPNQ